MNELRQMFLTPNPAQPRAERILVALRSKLSASYMELARASMGNMGVFESLTYSRRACELLPTSEDVIAHEKRVWKQAFWIHFGPGLAICLVFAVLAGINHGALNYAAAAIGALVAGIYCWIKLRTTTARTDLAFCHACLLPLAVASILATTLRLWSQVIFDASALVLVAITFVIDWMVFNKYGELLLRPVYRDSIGGSPLEVLNQIQSMLEPDWEKLRGYYVQLEPLYKHASAQIVTSETAPRRGARDAGEDDSSEQADDLPDLNEDGE
jgi:hypothetical protein